MRKQPSLLHTPWHPSKPTSRGASAYHAAVVHASWHRDNIYGLIQLIKKTIKTGDVVVDFGAGTGSSAVYITHHITRKFSLFLVDNSPSWLGNAYSLFHTNPHVTCLLLEKNQERYKTLDEIMGKETAHHVFAANTVHLIPNISEVFAGIYRVLRSNGIFTFQSGNIIRNDRKKDLLMIDDSVHRVHDFAISIIKTDKKYKRYKKDITARIQGELSQRKFVFPDPRPIEQYLDALKKNGFRNIQSSYKQIKVSYTDWLSFLRVRRLQAGILPEIGGKVPTPEEEQDRDEIITQASHMLFDQLKEKNSLADNTSFTTEWVYVQAQK